MNLKFGMKHQAMELYIVCINHDPGMTLAFFTTLPWGHLHAYYNSSQTISLVSQVSGERLQDHWSSGIDLWPSCSKLMKSLVNHSLKFLLAVLQIHCYFLLIKCESPLQCKGFSHFIDEK